MHSCWFNFQPTFSWQPNRHYNWRLMVIRRRITTKEIKKIKLENTKNCETQHSILLTYLLLRLDMWKAADTICKDISLPNCIAAIQEILPKLSWVFRRSFFSRTLSLCFQIWICTNSTELSPDFIPSSKIWGSCLPLYFHYSRLNFRLLVFLASIFTHDNNIRH